MRTISWELTLLCRFFDLNEKFWNLKGQKILMGGSRAQKLGTLSRYLMLSLRKLWGKVVRRKKKIFTIFDVH